MGTPVIPIDAWSYALAHRVANETGWRASEIYEFLIGLSGDRFKRSSIRDALDLLVRVRLRGEPFHDVVLRVSATILDVASREEEKN